MFSAKAHPLPASTEVPLELLRRKTLVFAHLVIHPGPALHVCVMTGDLEHATIEEE